MEVQQRKLMQPPRASSWFLLIAFNAVGLYIAGMALDLIPNDPSQWHVPRWIGALAGLAFILAGWLSVTDQIRYGSRLTRVLLAMLILVLGAVGNWMMFHPQTGVATGLSGNLRPPNTLVRIWTPLPEKYNRPLMIAAWDVPMGLFALWLLLGGRKPDRND